jgi:alkylation response protein AidB-like acyl-CoA dehydrogenase
MWVPANAATFLDTWSVVGMCGSGSHDFVIDDLFVPESATCFFADTPFQAGTLYCQRGIFTAMSAGFAANALGIARSAIDALIVMASREATTQSQILLRDRSAVQACVAQADAIVGAARGYVLDSMSRVWTVLSLNDADPTREIARARLAVPHAIHESVRAIDLVFHAAGTNAIYKANPLEQHFRDIHVAVQHIVASSIHYESAGKVMMGRGSTAGYT